MIESILILGWRYNREIQKQKRTKLEKAPVHESAKLHTVVENVDRAIRLVFMMTSLKQENVKSGK